MGGSQRNACLELPGSMVAMINGLSQTCQSAFPGAVGPVTVFGSHLVKSLCKLPGPGQLRHTSTLSKVVMYPMVRRLGARALRRVAGKLEDEASVTGLPEAVNRRLDASARRQRLILYIAALALAVAVGHVVYAALRDHLFDGSIF